MAELKTSSDKAYSILLNAILEDVLPRDEFLSQRKLAEMTGTSVISVREALKKLEYENFIEAIPKWGVRIPSLTKDRLIEISQVREGLEVMVAYLLALNATEEQREKLYQSAKECDLVEVNDENSIRRFSEKHRDLHLLMAEFTGNQHLKNNLEKIGLRMIIYRSAKWTWYQQIEYWGYWHQGLMDDIFSGDVCKAQYAMHDHIQHGLQHDIKMIEEEADE
jgi:DNA-binding GntR family transcriptional regulator